MCDASGAPLTKGILSTYMMNRSSEVFNLVTFLHWAPFFFFGNYYVETCESDPIIFITVQAHSLLVSICLSMLTSRPQDPQLRLTSGDCWSSYGQHKRVVCILLECYLVFVTLICVQFSQIKDMIQRDFLLI